ncbi:MAG TPA: chaperonin GroEL [Planctomycetota bacterium]|nr:chaperonin GroEL [Planctomycetota bacterium]
MAKQLMYEDEGRRKMQTGLRALAKAVSVTLGPSGRNVLMDRKSGRPQATRDGVTVSKEVELPDPIENVGAKLANAAADKTNDAAGDGTTTAIVLSEAIYSEGLRNLAAGANPSALKRGLDLAVEAAVEAVKKMSRPVEGREGYLNVARVSSHFDEPVAKLVADAIDKVGREGVITVEEGRTFDTKLEFVDGLQFDKGYISPYFINKADTLTAEYEDVFVLICDRKISNVAELVPILEQVAQTGKSILIIAEEVEGEALAALVVNKLRGVLKAIAVKAPAFGDRRKAILQDLAILTGGTVISDELGFKLEKVRLAQLGRADRVKVEKEATTLVGGAGDKKAVESRIEELRASIKKSTSDYDREKFAERLAKIQGGVAILRVGGSTESEVKERKYRVDDAVHAVRAAAEEGIVPGGGAALLRAAEAVGKLKLEGDEATGARIIARALRAPVGNIARNAGFDASVVTQETLEEGAGRVFDAMKGEFVDAFKSGLIDPAKVVRCALQNAASAASMLLTSGAVIVELKDPKKAVAGAIH